MLFQREDISNAECIGLYKSLLYPRLIEEKMLKLLRQGQVSKWFSGIGQEAISVGVTSALKDDEFIFPLHRNLGVFTSRGIPLERLMHQWQGNLNGFTKGRDRSFHFGAPDFHIVGMISHLAAMLSVADGAALAHLLRSENKVAVAFSGEGGTSEGEFHEAVNLAAVWNLPVLFVVENNGYGLSTPSNEQFKAESIASKGPGYGIASSSIDGNNILEVYSTVKIICEEMRVNPKPYLLECNTFRMRGHEEASGTAYVPKELMDGWALKDPIANFEKFLKQEKILNNEQMEEIRQAQIQTINKAAAIFKTKEALEVNSTVEFEDVYRQAEPIEWNPKASIQKSEMRFIDAIKDGLHIALKKYDELIFMGQDIAEYGGVFKITEGFADEFGLDRIRNTPISEAAPLGAALGLSIAGMKSMVEMQFADFVSCGFNQIVNNLAKTHYRWGQHADVVIRMPTGGGAAAGPFHSQSTESWFFHIPGLKVVYPSSPEDAKGLLLRAFSDPNPVLFFEHKYLYRNIKGEVPEGDFQIEIGKAKWLKQGSDLCIITYGLGVHWALDAVERLELDAGILDLRSLLPWDKERVKEAAERCSKILILHEDNLSGGIGAEISAWIGEHCFEYLDAPIVRLGALDTPIPFNPDLEQNYMPASRLDEALIQLKNY